MSTECTSQTCSTLTPTRDGHSAIDAGGGAAALPDPPSWADLCAWVRADLCRYKGARGLRGLCRTYVRRIGFRITFWLRVVSFLRGRPRLRPLYWMAALHGRSVALRYGVDIEAGSRIAPGLYLGHPSCVVVSGAAQIGPNCNLSPGVTVGRINRGPRRGAPTIGARVYVGPGAKILGNLRVGDDVAIGANAVVLEDVPPRSVVVGVPARRVSERGSEYYINWMCDDAS